MPLSEFGWTDRARPIIEIGVGDSRIDQVAAQWDVHRWDATDATWSGAEPEWLDVACETISARCEYGRQRTTDRFVPGVATVVVRNETGWADPHAATSPSQLVMRPGRAIRFGVEHIVFGTCWLFRGFIDAMQPVYEPDELDVVSLQCLDALGEVNRGKLIPSADPAFGGDRVDIRITRILDGVQWPRDARDIAVTGTTLIADVLGGQAADLLGQAADSGGGSVFGDLQGRVVFRNRDWQMYSPLDPPDGSIGNVDPFVPGYWTNVVPQVDGYLLPSATDSGSAETLTDPRGRVWTASSSPVVVRKVPAIPPQWVPASGDVCPTRWERPFDRADIATQVIVGRDLPTAQVFYDTEGLILYGLEPFERTDLLTERDDVITVLGERYLRTRASSTAPRIRSVSLDARTDLGALDLMSTVDVYKPSRYRCRLREPRGDIFDAEHFATAVVHELRRESWTLDLNLDLAAPWMAGDAGWDESYWDQALWADEIGASA